MQYNSDGLSSESREPHSFSLYHLCREIIFLCDSLQTVLSVKNVPVNQNLTADTLSQFHAPVNTEWELHSVIFQAVTLIWDRSLIHLFVISLHFKLDRDIYLFNSIPESLGGECNDHLFEREVQLHLSTVSSSPQHFAQDKGEWFQDHSYCSDLAKNNNSFRI